MTDHRPALRRLSAQDRNLLLLIGWCGLLLSYRLVYYIPGQWASLLELETGSSPYATLLFFGWNLFLAILPLAFAKGAAATQRPLFLAGWLLLWLLFLPNAPYLISDLQHLRPRDNVPFLLDQVLFFSFALAGIYAGGAAIVAVADRLRWSTWPTWARGLSWFLFPLVGYGVYLGRVARWNSWDLLLRPLSLAHGIVADLGHANSRAEILQYILLYGGITLLATGLVGKNSALSH
jgi:uncharacterized membrane protein